MLFKKLFNTQSAHQPEFIPESLGVITASDLKKYDKAFTVLAHIEKLKDRYFELGKRMDNLNWNIPDPDIADFLDDRLLGLAVDISDFTQKISANTDQAEGIRMLQGIMCSAEDHTKWYSEELRERVAGLLDASQELMKKVPEKTRRVNYESFWKRPRFSRNFRDIRQKAQQLNNELDAVLKDAQTARQAVRQAADQASDYICREYSITECNEFLNRLSDIEKLLDIVSQIPEVLSQTDDRQFTLLQKSSAERCLLELRKYISSAEAPKSKKLSSVLEDAVNNLNRSLDYKTVIKKADLQLQEMMIILKERMAQAGTRVNGIIILAESMKTGRQIDEKVLRDIRRQMQRVAIEYNRLEGVIPGILKDMQNPQKAEALAATLHNGSVDALYLSEFNRQMEELERLIKQMEKEMFQKKDTALQLPENIESETAPKIQAASETLQKLNLPEAYNKAKLLSTLETRLTRKPKNYKRPEGVDFSEVKTALEARPDLMYSLAQMENTGGAPDIIAVEADAFVFGDCSAESPDRRDLTYDQAAKMAKEFGVDMMTKDVYFAMHKSGKFDLKSWSWLATPYIIRKSGKALRGFRIVPGVDVSKRNARVHRKHGGWRGVLRVPKA